MGRGSEGLTGRQLAAHLAKMDDLTIWKAGDSVALPSYYHLPGEFQILDIDLAHSHVIIDPLTRQQDGNREHKEECYTFNNLQARVRSLERGQVFTLSVGELREWEEEEPDGRSERRRVTPVSQPTRPLGAAEQDGRMVTAPSAPDAGTGDANTQQRSDPSLPRDQPRDQRSASVTETDAERKKKWTRPKRPMGFGAYE